MSRYWYIKIPSDLDKIADKEKNSYRTSMYDFMTFLSVFGAGVSPGRLVMFRLAVCRLLGRREA
jgi:hypothetical protein